ncbi:pyrroline-5-carboxylate reductase dimerization-domain-containing protein [Dactylonectria estremocensis]|uniref:Pyrroline-5-carboxylate reductase dimerization-domain-containing protein n=1 Tax=Dactylonectria estremocensis TaxID=1079267 RepID=A0A9P9DZN4_9HYPO|nr:pyrroline-5-carboxylate reductase dimerization-domain-containing protein [Dactylonectria estremocensis]
MATLCILGCGNQGTAILEGLIRNREEEEPLPFSRYIACVRTEKSKRALEQQFSQNLDILEVYKGNNVKAILESIIVILAVDPADIASVLTQPGFADALEKRLLISVAAGWTRQKIETTLYGSETSESNAASRGWVIRTMPNIAAGVSQALTTIEISEPALIPGHLLQMTSNIFETVGKVVQVPPRLVNATTAVTGSTPAFFAVISDALIDAAVAVGVPREMAQTMIYQSMQGTATMLQSGIHPGVLKDQGTSPEGCTIAGLMVLEEGAVRGHIGRALRESVTVARLMENTTHVNDTRK